MINILKFIVRNELNPFNAYFSTLLHSTTYSFQYKNAGASILDGFSFVSQTSKQRSGVCISTPQKVCEMYTTQENVTNEVNERNQPSYLSTPRLYKIYYGMKDRCFNEKNSNYDRYGGRGISVCQEWENDRQSFIDWALQSGYEDSLQIDRINNDGNYEPSNCRWVTPKENCRNKSDNVNITYGGETKCAIEWCELLGVDYQKFLVRMKQGISPDEAFNTEYTYSDEAKKRDAQLYELRKIIDSQLFFFNANSIVNKWDKLKNRKA